MAVFTPSAAERGRHVRIMLRSPCPHKARAM